MKRQPLKKKFTHTHTHKHNVSSSNLNKSVQSNNINMQLLVELDHSNLDNLILF
jgi:hypothetical protein